LNFIFSVIQNDSTADTHNTMYGELDRPRLVESLIT